MGIITQTIATLISRLELVLVVGQAPKYKNIQNMPTPPMKIKIVGNIIKYGGHGFIFMMEQYSVF